MNAKICTAPKGGGSARGGVRYILGYQLGLKHEVAREAFHALMDEAAMRDDFGVGVVWSPAAGAGIRPSAVLARNVATLASADIEMDATAAGNTRVRVPVQHLVFSLDPETSKAVDDETLIRAAVGVVERIGLGEHEACTRCIGTPITRTSTSRSAA